PPLVKKRSVWCLSACAEAAIASTRTIASPHGLVSDAPFNERCLPRMTHASHGHVWTADMGEPLQKQILLRPDGLVGHDREPSRPSMAVRPKSRLSEMNCDSGLVSDQGPLTD